VLANVAALAWLHRYMWSAAEVPVGANALLVAVLLVAAMGFGQALIYLRTGVAGQNWTLNGVLIGLAAGSCLVALHCLRRSHADPELALFYKNLMDLSVFCAVLLALSFGLWEANRYCRAHDGRQRCVLTVILLALIVASCAVGLRSVGGRDADDLELALFRKDLAKVGPVSCVTVVTSEPLPPQLCYLIKSLWSENALTQAKSWEAAQTAPAQSRDSNGLRVLVCWRPFEPIRSSPPPGAKALTSAASPRVFRARELTAFIQKTGSL